MFPTLTPTNIFHPMGSSNNFPGFNTLPLPYPSTVLSEQERRDEKGATETLEQINPELAFNQLQGFAKGISTDGFDKGKFPFSSIGKYFEGRVDYHMYFIHKAKGKTQNIDNYGKHAFDNKDNKFGTTNEERLEAIRRTQIEIALMSLVKILNSSESKDLKAISYWVDRLGEFDDRKHESKLCEHLFKIHEERKLPRDGWNFGRWSFCGEHGKNADPLLKLEAVRRLRRELVDSLFKQAEPVSSKSPSLPGLPERKTIAHSPAAPVVHAEPGKDIDPSPSEMVEVMLNNLLSELLASKEQLSQSEIDALKSELVIMNERMVIKIKSLEEKVALKNISKQQAGQESIDILGVEVTEFMFRQSLPPGFSSSTLSPEELVEFEAMKSKFKKDFMKSFHGAVAAHLNPATSPLPQQKAGEYSLSEKEIREEKEAAKDLVEYNRPLVGGANLQKFGDQILLVGIDKAKKGCSLSFLGEFFEGRLYYHLYSIHKSSKKAQDITDYGRKAFYDEDGRWKTTNAERLEAIRRVQIEIPLMTLITLVEGIKTPAQDEERKLEAFTSYLGKQNNHKYENMLYGNLFKIHEELNLPRNGGDFGRDAMLGQHGKNAAPSLKLVALRRLRGELNLTWGTN